MICPSCGANVAATRFCENCGTPLSGSQSTTPIEQPTEPVSDYLFAGVQPTDQMPQVDEPATPSYVAEVPGDSAWQAQPPQAYQTSQTTQMPPQPDAGSYAPPAGSSQPPYRQSVPYSPPMGGQAPNVAFVLVIVGLVLSMLFVTFIPGIVCSIIGLVLNAGYNKNGLNNPRKTPTLVIGIIGIVIALLCLAFTIFVGAITAQVINDAEQQGINLASDNVQVTTDSNGSVKFTVTDSKSSASTSKESSGKSSGASAASSESASSAATSSKSASSAAVSGVIPDGGYADSKFHDSQWNPTLYAITELTGAEWSDMFESYNYSWDDEYSAWTASDGSIFAVSGFSGALSKGKIEKLPKGATGELVVIGLYVTGYDTPQDAFAALSKDVVVEDTYDYDDLLVADIRNSASEDYLVFVTEDDGAQMFLLFAENSIAGGLFEDLLGVDAGSSIDDVWQLFTGKSLSSAKTNA